MIPTRDPLTVNLTARDAWGIQMSLKFNNVMLSPLDNRPIFPISTIPFLRVKVNHALLRFAQEPTLASVALPLDYPECWCLDWVLNVQAWDGADKFLVQVLSVMAEHEMAGLHLKAASEGGDYEWKREDAAAFAEWTAKQAEQSDGST